MGACSPPADNRTMKLYRIARLIQQYSLPLLLAASIGLAGGATHAQGNAKAAKFYEDALVRYEKKDIEGAIIQLKNALQIDPNMLPVQMLLGKALMQNAEVAAAEVAYTEALRLGVNRAEVVVPLAKAVLAQGKPRVMLEHMNFRTADLPPGVQLEVLLLRASAYADLGENRNALRAIDEARAIDSRSPEVWLAEVPVRIRTRQFKEASVAADKALALLPPSSNRWWYQKGSIQQSQGDLSSALTSYNKVLQAEPTHIEARISRAGLLLDLGRFEDAAKDLTALQTSAPTDPRSAYLRALLAERNGDKTAANAALKEVTEFLDPVPIDFIRYQPQILMLNGLAHYGLGESGKARQYLDAFQKVQGDTPVSKLLARIYLGERNPAVAATLLENYLRSHPGDGQAITLLASAHMAMGRPAKSAALLQQALKAQDDPSFRSALGLSLVGGGQADNGITELEAAYKKDPRQTQAAVALIQLYLRSGQSRKAIPVAEGLVKAEPANAGYHNLHGMALGQSGNVAAARTSFEKAVQRNNNLANAKVNIARLEIAAKSYDAAAARLNELLKTDLKNSEAMFELAVIADLKGQQPEAQRWLEKARDVAPPKVLRWGLALVDFHLRNGRPGPALEAAKAAAAKAPDDVTTLLTYSRALLANGDTVGAKNTLSGATRFAEYDPALQVEIARLQMAANNPAGAAYSLEKALSGRPDYMPAQALMAEVEVRQGDVAKAEKRAREIVAQYPKRAVGYNLQGDIALAKSQPAAAIEGYRRAHQMEPSSRSLLRLFYALASQDGAKAAQQLAEQWLKDKPLDMPVRKALGDSFAVNGNFAAAQTAYEAALKVNPDDADVLNNLANVFLRLKSLPNAVKTAELALTKAPGNAAILDTLGWALFQTGQNDRALQLLRDARLRQPGNPEIRYHLAAVLAQTGRKNEAKEELEAALKAGTEFESAVDAGKLMQTVK